MTPARRAGATAGGTIAFIALFLPWYSFAGVDFSAWDALGWTGVILGATTISITLAALRNLERNVFLGAAVIILALVALSAVHTPDKVGDADAAYGMAIAALGAAITLVASLWPPRG